eukprot:TRINITY_DN6292_c0_g1_i3.p1 TRINITY_DN6292_c0_g1~~TRINITY_DN6292_c0_g1_i3.p1  ORF type:complete len:201 (-),score=17.03 TRINITY_DN6292_c0_g1_i3:107-709(-)
MLLRGRSAFAGAGAEAEISELFKTENGVHSPQHHIRGRSPADYQWAMQTNKHLPQVHRPRPSTLPHLLPSSPAAQQTLPVEEEKQMVAARLGRSPRRENHKLSNRPDTALPVLRRKTEASCTETSGSIGQHSRSLRVPKKTGYSGQYPESPRMQMRMVLRFPSLPMSASNVVFVRMAPSSPRALCSNVKAMQVTPRNLQG